MTMELVQAFSFHVLEDLYFTRRWKSLCGHMHICVILMIVYFGTRLYKSRIFFLLLKILRTETFLQKGKKKKASLTIKWFTVFEKLIYASMIPSFLVMTGVLLFKTFTQEQRRELLINFGPIWMCLYMRLFIFKVGQRRVHALCVSFYCWMLNPCCACRDQVQILA